MKKNLSEKLADLNFSEEFAICALSQISKLGLEPTPDVYALWYSYYTNDDCDLRNQVNDILTKKNNAIKLDDLRSVLKTQTKEVSALQNFQSNVGDVIAGVFDNTESLSQNTKHLGDYIHNLSQNNEKTEKDILQDIVQYTDMTLQQNAQLSYKIQEQRALVEKLQEDYQKIRQELITDSLTKVYNRRHLDSVLPDLIEQSTTQKKPFSLFMFDIDHFKKFNDTHGHLVGDTVLKFVGHMMKTIFKDKQDYLFRYGGEEFTILFPNMSKLEAHKFSTQLLNSIAKKEIILRENNKNIGHITISGGVAEYNRRESIDELIAKADTALYESKRNGRNQLTIAPL